MRLRFRLLGRAVRDRGSSSEFAAAVGAQHAVACATGTAAMHVALQARSASAPATRSSSPTSPSSGRSNPVAYQGADPLLVDSERDDLEPRSRRCSSRSSTSGRAAGERLPQGDRGRARAGPAGRGSTGPGDVCARHGIAVVEDAAESLGASWSSGPFAGRHTGTVGRDGRVLLQRQQDRHHRRRRHARHRRRGARPPRQAPDDPGASCPDIGYLHDEVGYNYRLTNLAAALGRRPARAAAGVRRRASAEIAARYDAAFAGTGARVLPPRRAALDSTYWLYSVLCPTAPRPPTATGCSSTCGRSGIRARALWRPLHLQPPFAGARRLGGAVGEDLFERGVSLPCSSSLTAEDQDRVVAAVLDYFEKN